MHAHHRAEGYLQVGGSEHPNQQAAAPLQPYKVYTNSCCCCFSLRTGTKILIAFDILGFVFAFLLAVGVFFLLQNVDIGVDVGEWLTQYAKSSAQFWVNTVILPLAGVVAAGTALHGMKTNNLRYIRYYVIWRFAEIVLSVTWTIIYVVSPLAKQDLRSLCEFLDEVMNSLPTQSPDEPLPTIYRDVDQCVEEQYSALTSNIFFNVFLSVAFSLYFAVCVLSYYNELRNGGYVQVGQQVLPRGMQSSGMNFGDDPENQPPVQYGQHQPEPLAMDVRPRPSAPSAPYE